MLNNIFYAITKSESIEISKSTVPIKLHDIFFSYNTNIFFFARYWIRTQRFRNLISFAFLFEKCIDPSPPSTNNCCRLHLLHFCFPVVFPFFLNFSISYVTENISSSLSIPFQIFIHNSIFHRPIFIPSSNSLTFHFF